MALSGHRLHGRPPGHGAPPAQRMVPNCFRIELGSALLAAGVGGAGAKGRNPDGRSVSLESVYVRPRPAACFTAAVLWLQKRKSDATNSLAYPSPFERSAGSTVEKAPADGGNVAAPCRRARAFTSS